MERVYIFDTTLRDGEQSPGASMDIEQKCEIAAQLEKLGVDIIEAGFPISSPQQLEGCQRVANERTNITVAALARALPKDIDVASEAIAKAVHPRIHTFISTSSIHMQHKLQKNPEEVLEMAVSAVRYARQRCAEVEFSPEDATRSDIDFMCRVIEGVIDAGATIINLPDTVGYSTPDEITHIMKSVRARVPNIDKAILSVHCHDDLGLAVANSLSGLHAGARQAEVTINGIGERAGNASLEELVMAINVRGEHLGLQTNIKTKEIYRTSRLVAGVTGFAVARNKAVVGENAFSHEAGIHQHGMLSNRNTYEIMTPESVGRSESKIILGRHSGIHGFKKRLSELGISVPPDDLQRLYKDFLKLADQKREVYDEDIIALVGDRFASQNNLYRLTGMRVLVDSASVPTATISITIEHQEREESATGDGPVDAIFNAIDLVVGIKPLLTEYLVHSLSPGKQAMGEVTIGLELNKRRASGRGSSTDILAASAKAYLDALNRLRLKQ